MAPNITHKKDSSRYQGPPDEHNTSYSLAKKSRLILTKPQDPVEKSTGHIENRDMLNHTIRMQAESKLWETL